MLMPLLRLPDDAASAAVRSFHQGPASERLEVVGRIFVEGFNGYLKNPAPTASSDRIQEISPEFQGFYAEGTAMAAAIAGAILPWSNRLRATLSEISPRFVHLAHVGAGWAIARVGPLGSTIKRRLDPMFLGLAHDGQGFHNAFFSRINWQQATGSTATERKAYDQGLGRALWFRSGGDPEHLEAALGGFPADRAGDLWAGVGLAACYAGPASNAVIDRLISASGRNQRYLQQGAAFAIAAFARAGHAPTHCQSAASRICAHDSRELPRIVEDLRLQATRGRTGDLASYHDWRERIAATMEGT